LNWRNKFRFEVSDTGIGLTQDEQFKLFKAFSQADGSITRKYGGTGIGLYISKQLVELMDGEIWVESEIGIGSKFIFEIDLIEKDLLIVDDNKMIINSDITALKGNKILLVEDNSINQEIILGLLENSGIKIDIANNGEEALKKYAIKKYELIFMDLQMPIMDGYEATKIIRAKDKDIPIIALTANAMKEDMQRTKLVGMNEHLNKPINVELLYKTLFKYLSNKSTKSQILKNDNKHIIIPNFTSIGLSYLLENKKLYL